MNKEKLQQLSSEINELNNEIEDLRLKESSARYKLAGMVVWLEQNQPDVFRRGLWDAITKCEV